MSYGIRLRLPPPQHAHDDRREFAHGSNVEAAYEFSLGCPPGPGIIAKGTRGTVTSAPVVRDDLVFGTNRMVPVRWDNGIAGEVSDRLLILLKED
jgi:hypothetical protein